MSDDNALYPGHTILPTRLYETLQYDAAQGAERNSRESAFIDWLVYQLFIRGMSDQKPGGDKMLPEVRRFYSDYEERVRVLHLKPYEPPK